MRVLLTSVVLCVFSLNAVAAVGDAKVTTFVPDGQLKAADEKAQGWDYTLSLTANFAVAQNSNVVGQPEGTSYLIGLGAVGSLIYVNGRHELKNSLTLMESFSKTPALDRLLKANDLARLESLYSYYFLKWLGAYGRLSFESPLLRTEDVRSELADYSITRRDGTVEVIPSVKVVKLADGFQPLTLMQSLGLIARPVDRPYSAVTLRAGAGARQTLAAGVLVNKDDKATLPIELVETASVVQAGVEMALGVAGKFPEQRLTYGVDASVLFPFLNNDVLARSTLELTRLGLAGYLNFSMFEWLGLTYQLMVARDPQLVSGIQLQNNVFLTFKYDVISPKKSKAVDPLVEARAAREAAEKRAQEAEVRATSLEQRVRELEKQTPPATAPTP